MPLINPQAIALLRSNAYNAAKSVLPGSDVTTYYTISADYVKMVRPRINQALTFNQIKHDPQFLMIVDRVKNAKKAEASGEGGGIGIGSWILYAGIAVGGWWVYKKYGHKLMGGKKSKRRSKSKKTGFIAALGGGEPAKVGA